MIRSLVIVVVLLPLILLFDNQTLVELVACACEPVLASSFK